MPQYENSTKLSHNQTQLLNNSFSQLKMTYMHIFAINTYINMTQHIIQQLQNFI